MWMRVCRTQNVAKRLRGLLAFICLYLLLSLATTKYSNISPLIICTCHSAKYVGNTTVNAGAAAAGRVKTKSSG